MRLRKEEGLENRQPKAKEDLEEEGNREDNDIAFKDDGEDDNDNDDGNNENYEEDDGDYYYDDKDCCGVNSYDYNVDRITSSSHISENLLQILILSIKLPVLHIMRYINF